MPSSSDGWAPATEPQGSSWDDPVVPQKETPDPDPPQPDTVQPQVSNEPKTYANLFKSQGFAAAVAAAPPSLPIQTQPPPSQTTPPAPQHTHSMVNILVCS